MSARVWLLASWGALAASVPGCSCDSFRFYDVTRTPVDECDILPQGEFCDPEGLSPPVFEVWAVERRGEETFVYVDEEVWVATPPAEGDDADAVRAEKLEVATRDPGPCTTTTTRSFEIIAKSGELSGTIDEKTRLTGAEACGDTPRGLRTHADLAGVEVGAP